MPTEQDSRNKDFVKQEAYLLDNVRVIEFVKGDPKPVDGSITKDLERCVNLDVRNRNPFLQLDKNLLNRVIVGRQLEGVFE
jgi:hypothetical protein